MNQDGIFMKFSARLALIQALVILFTAFIVPTPASAASFSNYDKALDLKVLGLLANAPEQFDLGRAPTRVEGAVMLVRLLGKEKLVKQNTYTHPFTDVPAWANNYVGYMYQNRLTNGIGNNRFGSEDLMSAKQYTVLVLRSIGYVDNIDFEYDNALNKAVQIGLISSSQREAYKKTSGFVRNDLVGISYQALSVRLKSSDKTLLDKLVNTDNAVYKPAARILGLYTSDLKAEYEGVSEFKPSVTTYGSAAKNRNDLFMLIRKALYAHDSQLKIDIRNYGGSIAEDFGPAFDRAVAAVTEITGVEDFVSSWRYMSGSHTFTLTLQYRYTKSSFDQRKDQAGAAVNKARQTVARLINPDMTEYDREKVLHDYIVNNTRYDYSNYLKGTIPDTSFSTYGCLVQGVAVCEGYSKAMKLLCDLSAIECIVVSGKSKSGGNWIGHAWNIVKIDGAYYHLDVTNDDPVMEDGSNALNYHYFNLPDSEIARVSTWDKTKYPACTSTANSYYNKNNLTADSKSAFENEVRKALDLRKNVIELKVADYTESRYANLTDIIFETNAVSKFSCSINEELGIIRIYNIQYV